MRLGILLAWSLGILSTPSRGFAQATFNGSGSGGATPGVPGRFIASPPPQTFSLRADAGAVVRVLRADAIAEATAALSLGAKTEIGGFYGVLDFGAGERFAGGRAYSGGVSALFQRPYGWFRLGGGLGLGYHAFETLGAWAYEAEGFVQVTLEIAPFEWPTFNPYVAFSGRLGGLFLGAASDAFFPASYAAGAALGVRFDD